MTRKPFQASDFMGGGGPGLAKLRAAKVDREMPMAVPRGKAGLENLMHLMRTGDWESAILLASRWSDLGDHGAAIHRGREAIMRPRFQRQLKRDPDQMIDEAKAALLERYPL